MKFYIGVKDDSWFDFLAREEYENGREYYACNSEPLINLPDRITDRPSQIFLSWHQE